jgi:hypothetical protein
VARGQRRAHVIFGLQRGIEGLQSSNRPPLYSSRRPFLRERAAAALIGKTTTSTPSPGPEAASVFVPRGIPSCICQEKANGDLLCKLCNQCSYARLPAVPWLRAPGLPCRRLGIRSQRLGITQELTKTLIFSPLHHHSTFLSFLRRRARRSGRGRGNHIWRREPGPYQCHLPMSPERQ